MIKKLKWNCKDGSVPKLHGGLYLPIKSSRDNLALFWPSPEPGTHVMQVKHSNISSKNSIFLKKLKWSQERMTYASSRPDSRLCRRLFSSRSAWATKTNPVSKQPVLETSSVIELTQHE